MTEPRAYYRRSPFLVCYWKDGRFRFENYLTGKVVAASARTAEVLDFMGDWKTAADVFRRWPEHTEKSLLNSIGALTRETLLETAKSKKIKGTRSARALLQWREWNPAAGFFHRSTKDAYSEEITKEEIRYIEGLMAGRAAQLRAQWREKKPAGARVVALKCVATRSEFPRVLLARRTWRKFSPKKVSREALATLLDLSFGVQRWEQIENVGKLAQKTSPSGGSLHPLEAYIVAHRVAGIAPGIYRYDAVRRKLVEVRRGANAAEIHRMLAGQWWFRDAAFVIFLTAVFGRSQWKYNYARAYRAILIEAGHLCQTFCLTATWLGLAPFCTVAFADTMIEKVLRVDGISESVIYAMGAGVKPGTK